MLRPLRGSPEGSRYADVTTLRPGDHVAPSALPDVVLDVGEILRARYVGGGEGEGSG